jgi:H3 lysine-79-specific histone-lysine N-methyltransferase
MKRFNVALADLQEEGTLAAWLTSPDYRITRSEWSALINVVHDSAYNRVVAPFVEQLAHHPKHPEDVAAAISEKEDSYGELGNTFMSKVIEQTGLKPESVFVDLGSGVGNCVMRAAVQAGCASYGFELLPVPSHCARKQLREVQRRWAMWCLDGNLSVECHEGDFRTHPDVRRRLTEADVVLVNNEVFPSSLNMDLTHLFLDLKEGATIVSLKPFVPEGFRMNESNVSSFLSPAPSLLTPVRLLRCHPPLHLAPVLLGLGVVEGRRWAVLCAGGRPHTARQVRGDDERAAEPRVGGGKWEE